MTEYQSQLNFLSPETQSWLVIEDRIAQREGRDLPERLVVQVLFEYFSWSMHSPEDNVFNHRHWPEVMKKREQLDDEAFLKWFTKWWYSRNRIENV